MVQQQQRIVDNLQAKIDAYNHTRIVSQPVLSLKPEGLTRKKLIVLIIFLAGFAGFSAMLLAMFRNKIRQREHEIS